MGEGEDALPEFDPRARIAAISDVIGANVFRSSWVNARPSWRFVRWSAPNVRPRCVSGIERNDSVWYPFFLNGPPNGESPGLETTNGNWWSTTHVVTGPARNPPAR